jgi:hypothetical protein
MRADSLVENGICFGRAEVLASVGEALDAAVEPLLLKQTFKSPSGSESIKLGHRSIPYHPDFKCSEWCSACGLSSEHCVLFGGGSPSPA